MSAPVKAELLDALGTLVDLQPPAPSLQSALAQSGFEVSEAENVWDAARCTVRDPAGHLIEIMAAPPP